jgi:hypothetical protein
MKSRAAVVKFLQRQKDILELINKFLQLLVPKALEDYVTSIPLHLGTGAYCDRRYWNKYVNRGKLTGASKQTSSRCGNTTLLKIVVVWSMTVWRTNLSAENGERIRSPVERLRERTALSAPRVGRSKSVERAGRRWKFKRQISRTECSDLVVCLEDWCNTFLRNIS